MNTKMDQDTLMKRTSKSLLNNSFPSSRSCDGGNEIFRSKRDRYMYMPRLVTIFLWQCYLRKGILAREEERRQVTTVSLGAICASEIKISVLWPPRCYASLSQYPELVLSKCYVGIVEDNWTDF